MIILDQKYTGFSDPTWALNEFQELVDPYKDTYENVLAVAPTSSGKSTLITMFGNKFIGTGKKIIYSGTMKALVSEKVDDWNEKGHPWENVTKCVISGDYTFDNEAIKLARKSEVIAITPEALISKLRNIASEKNAFLQDVGLLVVDEVHLLHDSARGANLEAAMIEFTHEFPHVQLVCLSATVLNSEEVADWITGLTGKKTVLIKSDYRPIPLKHTFMAIQRTDSVGGMRERIAKIVELVTSKPDEQFLVAVFRKSLGYELIKALKVAGIESEFHNANQGKANRNRIEKGFKSGLIRVVTTTSTLLTGVNLPARNVIISDVSLYMGDIDTFSLQQAAGRAGRPKYDMEGFVYYLLPADKFNYHKRRIEVGEPVISCMHEVSLLATHFLGAVYLERIKNIEDFMDWYSRTLAHTQNKYTDFQCMQLLNSVLQDLKRRGMITTDEDGTVSLKRRGTICAQMMLDPYFGFNLITNFHRLFSLNAPNDIDIAKAIGCCEQYGVGWLNYTDKQRVPNAIKHACDEKYHKMVTAIYNKMNGHDIPTEFMDAYYTLYKDIERIELALVRFSNECEGWNKPDFIKKIFLRIKRGLTWEQAGIAMKNYSNSEVRTIQREGIIITTDDIEKTTTIAKNILSLRRK